MWYENCLLVRAVVKHIHNADGILPGERFDGDDQCQYLYGDGWTSFQSERKPEFEVSETKVVNMFIYNILYLLSKHTTS